MPSELLFSSKCLFLIIHHSKSLCLYRNFLQILVYYCFWEENLLEKYSQNCDFSHFNVHMNLLYVYFSKLQFSDWATKSIAEQRSWIKFVEDILSRRIICPFLLKLYSKISGVYSHINSKYWSFCWRIIIEIKEKLNLLFLKVNVSSGRHSKNKTVSSTLNMSCVLSFCNRESKIPLWHLMDPRPSSRTFVFSVFKNYHTYYHIHLHW